MPQKRVFAAEMLTGLAAAADELGALEREYAPLKLKFDRIDVLRSLLRRACDALPASQTVDIEGSHFTVSIGARGPQKRVNLHKLFRLIGARAFVGLCSVSLKSLESAKVDPATVVTSELTGPRPLTLFEQAGA